MLIKMTCDVVYDYPICYRFYNCVGGVPYELPCATTLVFDEAQGTCVREEQASEFAKKCAKSLIKGEFSFRPNLRCVFFKNILRARISFWPNLCHISCGIHQRVGIKICSANPTALLYNIAR